MQTTDRSFEARFQRPRHACCAIATRQVVGRILAVVFPEVLQSLRIEVANTNLLRRRPAQLRVSDIVHIVARHVVVRCRVRHAQLVQRALDGRRRIEADIHRRCFQRDVAGPDHAVRIDRSDITIDQWTPLQGIWRAAFAGAQT